MCDHHSENKKMSGCRCGTGLPVEKFMQPCLLLLLKQRSAHGYDMIQLLPEFGFSDRLDPGTVYRNLRRLEEEGLVTSHWDVGEGGPARRLYGLTDEGRRCFMPGPSTSGSSANEWMTFRQVSITFDKDNKDLERGEKCVLL